MTNKCFFSRSYSTNTIAGHKAKGDIEDILLKSGVKNIGLPQKILKRKISSFFYNLISILKMCILINKENELIIQYPLKKYYIFCCFIAHLKGAVVTTIIHDLGSFRRKKLTIEKEIKKLSNTDKLIVHNKNMNKWLLDKGFSKPMINLEIFDYLSKNKAKEIKMPSDHKFNIIYAGNLSIIKNNFLYKISSYIIPNFLTLYGNGFDLSKIENKNNISYKGFMPSDSLIKNTQGHFGLVWDGENLDGCVGDWGHYLQYNNPHKTSLYIRCHLPIIIWEKAAMADFVKKEHIGITIDSLKNISSILNNISTEEYNQMENNVIKISTRLANGYYTKKAIF